MTGELKVPQNIITLLLVRNSQKNDLTIRGQRRPYLPSFFPKCQKLTISKRIVKKFVEGQPIKIAPRNLI